MRIEVIEGDITGLAVDAIVNAANPALSGGGGVDGAIHRAAGPALADACRALPADARGVRCPVGEARITPGFGLPARWIVHAAGPVWHGGDAGEDAQLRRCYDACLRIAQDTGIGSIAFPAISCGVYGYPPVRAVAIAVDAVRAWATTHGSPSRVVFSCFDAAMAGRYRDALHASDDLH